MPFTSWVQARAASEPKPFSVPVSQGWDGDDGDWSTFIVRVGTPPQTFRVLPATNGDETWIPIPLGCTNASIKDPPSNCGDSRGALPFQVKPSQGFNANASSTWQSNGIFNLIMEEHLGIDANGGYGFDTVTLGDEINALSLPHQVVAGVASSKYWLGSLGLSPKPVNFSVTIPSLMSNLVSQNLIPSLSFGYTAGAKYNTSSPSFGSLTLGGYDKARQISNDVAFDFDPNDSRSLTVGIQAITATNTFNGTVSIISAPGIYSLIDSGVPDIWLPKAACDVVEQAFGLKFDDTSQRYLIDTATRTKMDTLNPTIVFNLGPQADAVTEDTKDEKASSVAITLPYAAFVLQGTYPLFPNATNYFPIRRAANDTQYTIGRAFLQEAYITVDYERSKFRISQATSDPARNKNNLVTIPSSGPDPLDSNNNSHRISNGALAGIIIGCVAFLFFLCGLAYLYIRRRCHRHRQQSLDSAATDTRHINPCSPSTHSNGELKDLSNYLSPTSTDKSDWENSLEKNMHPAFSPNSTTKHELESPVTTLATKHELESPVTATTATKIELPTPISSLRRHQELPGSSAAGELDGKRQAIYELPTNDEWLTELPHGTHGQIRRSHRPRQNLVLQI